MEGLSQTRRQPAGFCPQQRVLQLELSQAAPNSERTPKPRCLTLAPPLPRRTEQPPAWRVASPVVPSPSPTGQPRCLPANQAAWPLPCVTCPPNRKARGPPGSCREAGSTLDPEAVRGPARGRLRLLGVGACQAPAF